MRMYNPTHPGNVLREYIEGYSITDIARRLGVTRVTLSRILNAKASITPEMSLRLSELLGTSPEVWLNLQNQYDIWQLEQQPKFQIVPLFAPSSASEASPAL